MLRLPRRARQQRTAPARARADPPLHHRGAPLRQQIATHAVGDAALDVVLDAYEEAQRLHPRADVRHRVEHAAVTSDAQVARIARLGLIPVPQGRFLSEIGDGLLTALGPVRSGPVRSQLAYRMRSFLDAGVVLPGSSDAPVVASDPLLGIADMVNRRTASGAPIGPHEAVTARSSATTSSAWPRTASPP
ncbi:amidohydrolase family protein [Streptomyces sp. NPDC058451]|uniref:amidohydrolase family protein n=1 Tax=Streptomyces sp. NPDC058451 TaxID=3346506 RepID=UPI003646022C